MSPTALGVPTSSTTVELSGQIRDRLDVSEVSGYQTRCLSNDDMADHRRSIHARAISDFGIKQDVSGSVRANIKKKKGKTSKAEKRSGFTTAKSSRGNNKQHKYNSCAQETITISDLNQHKQIHDKNRKNYQCHICNNTFVTQKNLEQHQRRFHADEKKMEYTCEICHRGYKTMMHLNRHKKLHTTKRDYPCICCSKTFTTWSYFHKHNLRMHTSDNKKHICNICNKSFMFHCQLEKHQRTHSNKKFGCDTCGRSCANMRSLHRHKKNMHNHDNNKKHYYKCSTCHQCFNFRKELQQHLTREHTNSRNNPYEKHGDQLSRPVQSTIHIKLAPRPDKSLFKCKQCPAVFSKLNYLNSHIATHTDDYSHGEMKPEKTNEHENKAIPEVTPTEKYGNDSKSAGTRLHAMVNQPSTSGTDVNKLQNQAAYDEVPDPFENQSSPVPDLPFEKLSECDDDSLFSQTCKFFSCSPEIVHRQRPARSSDSTVSLSSNISGSSQPPSVRILVRPPWWDFNTTM